ncbi:putative xanthine dehydrogenase subunit A [Sporomusa ovata DSM 2662]|uniref:Xanthine and CO dehydrogenases maturation factor, XdhC/CoxF family n=1 Tax=Sporomusa ovata TaxID=2378 RepID=A0A0U1KZG2_9FIRM|nr:XdhC/CoxI family protein [Sporomusa ovata]EQB29540.1 xanthine and CO dehydrogenases maturation factor, XdhC/CoxF family [Sporomusa ovata DSM 2662]CQR72054.1 Xanthine and CO dehydrogenases maturation factor, XdhC/CoxF family [Sporomusa ovata]
MKKLYQNLVKLLSTGENVVLATIFHSAGSAPRSAGAKMIICPDGSIIGTVGGGRVEADTIELAKEVLANRQSVILPFDLTGADAAGLGMICGGKGEILLDYLDAANNDNRLIYEAILATMNKAQKAWLMTELSSHPVAGQTRQQCLVMQDGTIIGNFHCEPEFLEKMSSGPAKISIHADANENRIFIVDPIRTISTVYLFGAGHISQQIAKLTEMVGFVTVVIDDRPAFANRERFPLSEIMVVDNFECMAKLPIDQDSYLVIVTRGHLHDRTVLEQALETEAGYIGMIGSKNKRDHLYKILQEQGVSAAKLQQVYSPIGIDIYAETPEEIAVSIVAELIKARVEREKCIAQG